MTLWTAARQASLSYHLSDFAQVTECFHMCYLFCASQVIILLDSLRLKEVK